MEKSLQNWETEEKREHQFKHASFLTYCRTDKTYILYKYCKVDSHKKFPTVVWKENSRLCSGPFFPSYITQGHWCMVLFEFGIMWEVRRQVSGSVLNFTGLRNSRFSGNTDHLVQGCNCPEVGELSPYLLTTSLGPLNHWDCQGERAVPKGGFAVIEQRNTDSASTVCLYEFACACSVSLLTLIVCSALVQSMSSPGVREC